MGKIAVLKNIFLIVMLIGLVYVVSYYAEPVQTSVLGMLNLEEESVLGSSSQRAQEITGKVNADIGQFFVAAQKQLLEVTLGDILATIARAQQIPQDIQSLHTFIKEQAESVLQSVNQK